MPYLRYIPNILFTLLVLLLPDVLFADTVLDKIGRERALLFGIIFGLTVALLYVGILYLRRRLFPNRFSSMQSEFRTRNHHSSSSAGRQPQFPNTDRRKAAPPAVPSVMHGDRRQGDRRIGKSIDQEEDRRDSDRRQSDHRFYLPYHIISLASALPSPAIIADLELRALFVNEAFSTAYGFDSNELLGSTPAYLTASPTTTKQHSEMWKYLAAGNAWRGKLEISNKDGSTVTESATVVPLRNHLGKIVHYMVIHGLKD